MPRLKALKSNPQELNVLGDLVETTGLEPVTPCMSSKYSNQLSYASDSVITIPHIYKYCKAFYKIILQDMCRFTIEVLQN